jgi:oxygen-dependent protoporphyrinogen oxidase
MSWPTRYDHPGRDPSRGPRFDTEVRFVVVGGGISGLAAALRLRDLATAAQTDAEIVVVERSDRLGGKLHTTGLGDFKVEAGAESFLMWDGGAESRAYALARRVGLGDDLTHPAAVPAAIALPTGLHPFPAGTLLGVPADVSTLDGLARAADLDRDTGEPLLAVGDDVAVGALVRRRMGDEVVDRLVDPMLGGVYAGRADDLSLAATMPGLHAAATRHSTLAGAVGAALNASPRPAGRPVFATVPGGLSRFVAAVADAAAATVWRGETVRAIARSTEGWRLTIGATRDARRLDADAVILAVPSHPASRLLAGVAPGAAAETGVLDYASVALATLVLPAGTALPRLSGLLVPSGTGHHIKAATFVSTKWPQRRDEVVLVRVSLGRYGEEAVLQRTDEDLAALARRELGAVLDATLPAPVATRVDRWGGALPQYGVGHVARVARTRAALPPRLALAGAAFDGVGIAACVRSGETAAEAVWTDVVGEWPA